MSGHSNAPTTPPHDHKGYSEEKCVRCGWVMGNPPLNCQNDDTPHQFPSQLTNGRSPSSGDAPDPIRLHDCGRFHRPSEPCRDGDAS